MLGEGAYGYVKNINNTAVKKFKKMSHLIQEYTALSYLKECKYVVHALDVDYNKLELYMELYDCSLRQWMKDACNCEDCIFTILRDILRGLIELQSLNLSHSDIKPGNILIKRDPLCAVLGDCGFVSLHKHSKQQRTARSYRDLKVVNDDKHDMFSFGIVFLELVYKVRPYIKDTYNDYLNVINKKVTSSNHRKLLRLLLNEDRSLRPNAAETLKLLYNDTYTFDKIINNKNVNNNRYLKHDLVKLKKLIIEVCHFSDIRRSKRGYQALLIYLCNNNVKDLNYYAAATLFILASLFSNKPADMTTIFEMCNIKDKNKVFTIIYDLTHYQPFVNTLFY